MKPKVTFITPSLGLGGAEKWILTLAKAFKKLTPYKIINLSGKQDQIIFNEALSITNVLSKNFYNSLDDLKNELIDSDVVISWGYNAQLDLKQFDFPSIDVSHSDPSWENHYILIKQTEKKSKYHVGVSKTATSSFENKNAVTIYNGINIKSLKTNIGRINQRKEWDCENKKVVLFLGRLSNEKNPLLVLETSKSFGNDWKFIFVESGPLLKIFNDIYQENVKLVPKTKHVGDYYAAADVVVMPSKVEGMPLVLLESWYSQVPIVTSEYSTYKELKDLHGELCWSIKENNSIELMKKIKIAYLSGRNNERVKKAKKIVEDNYTSEIMAENWENYIFSLLNNE